MSEVCDLRIYPSWLLVTCGGDVYVVVLSLSVVRYDICYDKGISPMRIQCTGIDKISSENNRLRQVVFWDQKDGSRRV